MRCLRTIG